MRRLFPWRPAASAYVDDGPAERTIFTIFGAKMSVEPSGDFGHDTCRTRYKVECLTCNVLVHPSTTGTSIRCEEHLKEAHVNREMTIYLEQEISFRKKELEKIRTLCPHPGAIRNEQSTGNRGDDYWTECTCEVCGKRWIE